MGKKKNPKNKSGGGTTEDQSGVAQSASPDTSEPSAPTSIPNGQIVSEDIKSPKVASMVDTSSGPTSPNSKIANNQPMTGAKSGVITQPPRVKESAPISNDTQSAPVVGPDGEEKTREQIMAERKAKKEAKKNKTVTKQTGPSDKSSGGEKPDNPKPPSTKEAAPGKPKPAQTSKSDAPSQKLQTCFQDEAVGDGPSIAGGTGQISPAFLELKAKLSEPSTGGGGVAATAAFGVDEMCAALVDAFLKAIEDFVFVEDKPSMRQMEELVDGNASAALSNDDVPQPLSNIVRQLKLQIRQFKATSEDAPDQEIKDTLLDWLKSFAEFQMNLASTAICHQLRSKIKENPRVLVFSWSSLVFQILADAHASGIAFSVIVVDNHELEGQRMLKEVMALGVECIYVSLTGLHYVIRDVDLVLLSAESVLLNGSVVARFGANTICLSASANNLPVLVACQTYKFSDKILTSILYPSPSGSGASKSTATPMATRCRREVVDANMISGIVSELRILPCSSVHAVTRAKLLTT